VKLINPFESNGRWFKANLHTHSTTSDGEATPQQRIEQSREHNYDVLALTDHRATNGGNCYHLVALNVPFGFEPEETDDANAYVRQIKDIGGDVLIAHPYWCGHNINHLMPLTGCIGLEVYNATCTRIGKGYSSVVWDDLLDAGNILPAVAVDDVHGGRDIFMGWTMIKAETLTLDAIMAALRTGCYYASSGPVIEDFRVQGDTVVVKCSPVVEIHFMSKRSQGRSFYTEPGATLTDAEREVSPELGYVRAEVLDAQGRRAWTNPLMLG